MEVTKNEARYRHVKAGLDNAVTQAEKSGLLNLFVLDADCHQMEPFRLLADHLEDDEGEIRRLFLEEDPEDPFFGRKDSLDIPSRFEHPPVENYRHGPRKRAEITYPKPQTPEEVIDTFTRRIHDIGIRQSIIFPTPLLTLAMDPRHEFEVATTRAYTRFYLEHFQSKFPELASPLMVPVNSPERAAEMIDDVGQEKGIIGVMVPSMTPKLAGTDDWDPIYQAAQSRDLPICMHGSNYFGGMFQDFKKFIGPMTLSRPVTLAIQLASIVLNGVPERFPRLRFAFVEGGVSWIPWIMQRMDSVYLMRKEEAPLLTKMPSEYVRDFFFTSQPLEYYANLDEMRVCFEKFDAENHLMFSSDYPHWDFDVPSMIYDLPFLSETAKKKILGENAASFFKMGGGAS